MFCSYYFIMLQVAKSSYCFKCEIWNECQWSHHQGPLTVHLAQTDGQCVPSDKIISMSWVMSICSQSLKLLIVTSYSWSSVSPGPASPEGLERGCFSGLTWQNGVGSVGPRRILTQPDISCEYRRCRQRGRQGDSGEGLWVFEGWLYGFIHRKNWRDLKLWSWSCEEQCR